MIAEVGYAIGPYLVQCNLKSAAVTSADVILAISETTAQQFVRFNPASASRIHTIPLGHEHLNKTTSGKLVVLPDTKPYCLFVWWKIRLQKLLHTGRGIKPAGMAVAFEPGRSGCSL